MPKVDQQTLAVLSQEISGDSKLNLNFIFLSVASCIIATCGLLLNSPAVIIGAMIVAPLMLPLRGLALGAMKGDVFLFRRGITTLLVGTIISLVLSAVIGAVANIPLTEFSPEILARTQPNLLDLVIALAAGAVGGFAKVRPKISDAIAGTAISVALMPPLCVVGLALSQGATLAARGAFLLYTTNLLGITLACILVFIWEGYYVEKIRMARALTYTVLLTLPIVIPLSISLGQLLRQTRLQSTLRSILVTRTITVGQQVELVQTRINWNRNPPEVYLRVRTRPDAPLTPRQVFEVERLVIREMRQDFLLVFQVESFDEIRSEDLFGYRVPYQEGEEDEVDSTSEPLSPETLERIGQTIWRLNGFLNQPMQRRTVQGRDSLG
ncbi:TIGR00341 family protein [Sodalinema gerasimenkoae]|uniref:TIGR00341 family protein n=1 Tax=Sodalinema gerasimenkoae TaxID=2862348 RepID=UPI001357A1E6|nr:TIGR00341 family protein [Sodalinema gerasimenkoae]